MSAKTLTGPSQMWMIRTSQWAGIRTTSSESSRTESILTSLKALLGDSHQSLVSLGTMSMFSKMIRTIRSILIQSYTRCRFYHRSTRLSRPPSIYTVRLWKPKRELNTSDRQMILSISKRKFSLQTLHWLRRGLLFGLSDILEVLNLDSSWFKKQTSWKK